MNHSLTDNLKLKNWITYWYSACGFFKGNFYTACWCLVEYMQHWHWYKLFGAAQFTLWSIHIEHCTLSRTRCCIALFTLFSNYAIFNHPIDKYFVSNVHSFMYVCNQPKGCYLRRWRCYWKKIIYTWILRFVFRKHLDIDWFEIGISNRATIWWSKVLTDSITLFVFLSFLSFCLSLFLYLCLFVSVILSSS